jgi:hypothetical protein
MFIQDSLTPISRISDLDMYKFNNNTMYSFHYSAKIKDGGHLDELYNVYNDTNLHLLSNICPETDIIGTAHTSFITNHKNVRTILQLEDAYINKNIIKTKIHSWLSERTGGLMCDIANNIRIDISPYFLKHNLKRDYE